MSVMQEQTGTSLSVDPHPTTPPSARGQYGRLVWGIALVVLVVDQGTKAWALSRLDPGVARPFIGDLITLQLVRNAGAAFSLFEGMTYLVTALAVGVVGWIFVLAHGRLASRAYGWCLGAVAGGALGNLGDRFFRDPGPGRLFWLLRRECRRHRDSPRRARDPPAGPPWHSPRWNAGYA